MTDTPSAGPGIETALSPTALLAAYNRPRRLRISLAVAGLLIAYGLAELRVAVDPAPAVNVLVVVLIVYLFLSGMWVVCTMVVYGDARFVRRWLRNFDAEPVAWEFCTYGSRGHYVVLTGRQGRLPIPKPWRKRVLARTGGRVLFTGDFRTGGVVISTDLRRFMHVRPIQLLPYAEFQPWRTDPRNTSLWIATNYPYPVVDVRTIAAEDRKYPQPDAYTPPEIVRLRQQNQDGKDLGPWRMDGTGIHLEAPVPMTVSWGVLQEVAVVEEQLHGRLHNSDDVPDWPLTIPSTRMHPDHVLLGVFYGTAKSTDADFLRRFAADVEHFAHSANIRILVPPTPAWLANECPKPR